MNNTEKKDNLENFGGTNLPHKLGHSLMMNTNAIARLSFLPEDERIKISKKLVETKKTEFKS